MADDVSVKFGASLGDLIDGVKQAKEAIESVKSSVDVVTEGFKSLAEIAGVAISIEGFKSFVETMAELGDRTQTSMARLGQSAEQITLLQGVASASGTSFEGLQQSIEKASLSIQKSAKDSYGVASQALKTLGLSANDLIGLPADQWFARISDSVSKFNPSLNLTNAVTAAFGKTAAQMLPLLLQGADHFKEMQAAVRAAQEGLAAAIPGMAETHEKLSLLGTSLQSFGARVFSVLKPAIDGAITWFTNLVQSIDTTTILSAVQRVSAGIVTIIQTVGTFAINVMGYIDNLGVSMDEMMKKLSLMATGAAAGGLLGSMLGGVGAVPGALLGGATGAAVDELRQWFEGYQGVAKDGEAKMEVRRDALKKLVESTKTVLADMSKGLQATAPTGGSTGKFDAGSIDAGAKNELAAQALRIDAQITAEQNKLTRIKAIINQEADAYKITEGQKAVYTETAIEQAFEAEMGLIAKKEQLYAGDVAKYAQVEAEKAKLTEQYQNEMLKAVQDSQRSMTASITSGLSTLTGAFNSQLRGLLAGATSWATAMKSITGDMIIKMIELGEEWAVKRAASMIADAVTSKTLAAADVTTHAAAEAAKTGATVAGATARTSAEATSSTVGLGTQIANAVASVGIDAGKAFAGVFGFLAPIMGPAAAGPATASAAEVMAGGLTPLAVGAWEIPGVMPALLHPGEMVVPAGPAKNFRDGLGGGSSSAASAGGDTHLHFEINGGINDAASITKWFNQNAATIARALGKQAVLNPGSA